MSNLSESYDYNIVNRRYGEQAPKVVSVDNSKEGILYYLLIFNPLPHGKFVVLDILCGLNMAPAVCRVSTQPRTRAVGFSYTMISEMEAKPYCRFWVGVSAAIKDAQKLSTPSAWFTHCLATLTVTTFLIRNGGPPNVSHPRIRGNTAHAIMSKGRWTDAGAGNAARCEA